MKTRIYIIKGKNGEWFWRAKRGANVVCDGGEGYKRRAGLLKSLKAFLASIRNGQYELHGEERSG